jgi:hypothetical protein
LARLEITRGCLIYPPFFAELLSRSLLFRRTESSALEANIALTLRYPHKISIKNNALLGKIRIKTRFSQSEHKNSF